MKEAETFFGGPTDIPRTRLLGKDRKPNEFSGRIDVIYG